MKKLWVGILSLVALLFGITSMLYFSYVYTRNCEYVCDIERAIGFLFLYLAVLSIVIALRVHTGSFGVPGRLYLTLPFLIPGGILMIDVIGWYRDPLEEAPISITDRRVILSAISLFLGWLIWRSTKPAVKRLDG